MGLFRLGIWLHPKELNSLFNVLDSDGGGQIDVGEFQAFWDDNGDKPRDDMVGFKSAMLRVARALSPLAIRMNSVDD